MCVPACLCVCKFPVLLFTAARNQIKQLQPCVCLPLLLPSLSLFTLFPFPLLIMGQLCKLVQLQGKFNSSAEAGQLGEGSEVATDNHNVNVLQLEAPFKSCLGPVAHEELSLGSIPICHTHVEYATSSDCLSRNFLKAMRSLPSSEIGLVIVWFTTN